MMRSSLTVHDREEHMPTTRSMLATLALSIVVSGCGQSNNESEPQSTEEASNEATSNSVPTPPADTQSASVDRSVSVSDIDRWQRGMDAELRATQDAAAKLAEAKDENAKLEALHAATEMGTLNAGAEAAGIDQDSYRRIRNVFSDAVSKLSPLEMEMDVAQMPPQMIEQMKQSRAASAKQLENQLPADVLDALKPRAGELRTQQKTLIAERLKVATGAR